MFYEGRHNMSQIYGFKFKYNDFTSRTYNKYIILERGSNSCCLQCFENGSVYSADITNKEDELCDRLLKMNINSWHMKELDESMELFPGFVWSLLIEADDIFVLCGGWHTFPSNWADFVSIMEDIGITMFSN